MPERGLFIVIEGIDGCGKTTQAIKLIDWIFGFSKKVNTIALTREPTHSKFAQEIYTRLADNEGTTQGKERLLELFVLDREEHVNTVIAPALAKGHIVVCDRYKYSNIAYQTAQGVPVKHVIDENGGYPIPDITFIFNANPETCVARMEKSGKKMDKFEKTAFLEKVKENYLRLPALLPKEKFQIVNANQSIDQMHSDVVKAVRPLLELYAK